MTKLAFGHQLETIHDGLSVVGSGGRIVPRPMPLQQTDIKVAIRGGLATVITTRSFANAEAVPIEAILTFPVGFDAVVTGLSVVVEGRRLQGVAEPKEAARAAYEAAIDRGKLAVLHDEVLRGVHMVSVAQLAPGQEICVELEAVMPLTLAGSQAVLRLPQTVGQLYGASPLMPSDDLTVGHGVMHRAEVTVTGAGVVALGGSTLADGQSVTVALDRAVEITLSEAGFAPVAGVAADGRRVEMQFHPITTGERPLDLAILVDRSGSTATEVGDRGQTIWSAMRDGLYHGLRGLTPSDTVMLWQFDNTCEFLGSGSGPAAAGLLTKLGKPNSGTEMGKAIAKLIAHGARDILVLTDGLTWAREVDDLAAAKCRISAILVGADSLDANIGHLVTLTGGQMYYAPGDDVAEALGSALTVARTPGTAALGQVENGQPLHLTCQRGGVTIAAQWSDLPEAAPVDAIGRFAAALALPLMSPHDSLDLALRHGLCTHATSLVLVDEAGEATNLVPELRKVSLAEAPVVLFSQQISSRRMMDVVDCPQDTLRANKPAFLRERTAQLDITRDLGREIDWDTAANAFLQGDMSALTPAERRLLGKMCGKHAFIDVAAALGVPVEWVGLAYVAATVRATNKAADRFVRRVLGGDADHILHDLDQKHRPRNGLWI